MARPAEQQLTITNLQQLTNPFLTCPSNHSTWSLASLVQLARILCGKGAGRPMSRRVRVSEEARAEKPQKQSRRRTAQGFARDWYIAHGHLAMLRL